MRKNSSKRHLKALAVLLAVLCIPLLSANAQTTGSVRGKVTDTRSGRPVTDAAVTISGTTVGAVSNQNGDYVVNGVPEGARSVVIRRIGYQRQTRSITVGAGAATQVNFSMSESATQLDQVVVTGTGGAAERKTLGNSITVLNVAELTEKQSIQNVTEVLQSKTPGVMILPGSGATGTAGEIRIRGASSLAGYKPVVFIDGIRFNIDDLGGFSATGGGTAGLAQSTQVTSALNNLDPNSIESIEVLKGPAAATLYGAEAANGVIQIITKKGTRGQQQMRWNFKAERGASDYHFLPADNLTTCDAVKQAQVVSVTDTTHLWPGCQGIPVNTVISGNPMRDDERALREGGVSRLSMGLRGGGSNYSFYLSGDRSNEQGVFRNSDNNNSSFRSNFGFNPNDKANVAINLNYQSGRVRLPIQDESVNGLLLSATRGLPGRLSLLGPGNEGWRTISPTAANRYENYTNTDRLTLGGTFSYNPFSWFQNRFTAGFDNTVVQAQLLFLPGVIDATQDPDAASGANLRRTPTRKVLTIDYAGTALWHARPNLLMTTTFGSQVVSDKSARLAATGIGIGAVDVTQVDLLTRTTGGEAFSENNSVGYYLQEQLGWNDRLFLTAALRADDHSSFGTNFDLITYPKLSASYVISDEPTFKGMLANARVSTLKLRTAWGQAGRAPTAYSAPQTYTISRVTLGTPTGNTTASTITTQGYGNPDLKPERGEEIELGFDLGMFSERLGVDFTYYNKKTSDMLQATAVAPSTGFIGTKLANLGAVTNKGLEIGINASPLQLANFGWQSRITYAGNHNELTEFGILGKVVDNPTGQAYGTVQQHRVGYPLGGYWVAPVLRGPDGAALLTTAGAATFDTARAYVGPSTPTRQFGLSNTFTVFKNFRIYALLDHQTGGFTFNQQERSRCQTANDNCTRTNNPSARFPKTAADTIMFKELAVYRSASISPEWIQKTDFTKLRELSLTYDIPVALMKNLGGRTASVVLSGRNLKIWSDYEGADPEVNSYGGRSFVRVDAYAAPQTRRLTATVNVQY